jgi:hypothetical protein
MLLDRKCSECSHLELDCYERGDIPVNLTCPVCHSLTLKKMITMPHVGRESIVNAVRWIDHENKGCERTYEVGHV